MLRLTSISICAENTGSQVDLHIQSTLRLKSIVRRSNCNVPNESPWGSRGPYQGSSAGNDDTAAGQGIRSALRNDVDARGRETQMLSIAGRRLASYLNEAVTRIDGDIATLEAGLGTLREKQDSHSDDISNLMAEVSSFRDTVKENQKSAGSISDIVALREHMASSVSAISAVQQDSDNRLRSAWESLSQNMDGVRGGLTRAQRERQDLRMWLGDHRSLHREDTLAEDNYAKEFRLLRAEVKQLRDATARDYATSQASHKNTLYREELVILIDNVAKFGNRISEVEILQMESKLLKSRVQCLEANSAPAGGAGL